MQVLLHQLEGKYVGPGGHRCVGGEDGGISHPLGSLLEGGPRFYQLPDALQDREGRVAFVQVESSRPDTQRLQHTHSSHTQDDLLPQPLLDIADIEVMGYFAIPGLIALQVRVQQVERDPAHRRLPDRHVYRGIEERYADYDRITLPLPPQNWGGLRGGSSVCSMSSCHPSSRIRCQT